MQLRILTLLRRQIAAAKLGFAFCGTTRTKFPSSARLRGRRTLLHIPSEGGYLNDIINVWLDDEYGLKSLKSTPRTVLDVGANVGLFSLWAAHHLHQATIHAYEPNPRVRPYLHANLAQVPVTAFMTGLGANGGRAVMVDCGESRMAATQISGDGEIILEPLAEAIHRLGGQVDLMKIDCEGAEWDMFEDEDSLRKVKEIRMEYHLVNGHTLEEFKRKVAELGFSLVRLFPNQGFGVAWLRRHDK